MIRNETESDFTFRPIIFLKQEKYICYYYNILRHNKTKQK